VAASRDDDLREDENGATAFAPQAGPDQGEVLHGAFFDWFL
jgi:hypothetical protein